MAALPYKFEKFLPRHYLTQLEEWVKEAGCPILLSGWRQVGKSTSLAHFGDTHFDDTYHLNFVMDPDLARCFEEPNPKLVLAKLESRRSRKIVPGKTLLILDEVQSCPKAIEVLGHFRDAFPKLHVIACGTFVDFAKQAVDFNIPVGRVTYMNLHPMTFKEFLLAVGEIDLFQCLSDFSWESEVTKEQHQQLLSRMNEYMMLGGMPAIVSTYVQSNQSWAAVREQQRQLWQSVRDTFSNMMQDIVGEESDQLLLKMLQAISHEIQNVSQLSQHLDSKTLNQSLNRVFQSGLFARVNAVSAEQESIFLPINSDDVFRTAFIDIGLLHYALTAHNERSVLTNPMQQYGGMLARQFVGQHLWGCSKGNMSLKYPRYMQQGSEKFDFSYGEYGVTVGENPHGLFGGQITSEVKDIQIGLNPLSIRQGHLICPLYLIEESAHLAATAQEAAVGANRFVSSPAA